MMKYLLSTIMITALVTCLSAQNTSGSKRIGLYTMNIGEIEAVVISDGHLLVNPVQAEFAQHMDPSKVAETLKEHFASPTEIDLAMNILLLKIGTHRILIDVGAGYRFGNGCGHLTENLRYAGISPDEITDIVLTHAHPDHIGGLTNQKGELIFPNANVYIAEAEYKFWMSQKPDFSKSTMTDMVHKKMLVDVAQQNITATVDKLHLFHNGDDLLGCLQMNITAGHTPGHTIIRIYSQSDELYHIADIVHSEIISFINPEWIYNSDTDYRSGNESRRVVLTKMAESKALFFAYHLPWPGLGYAKKQANIYEWVQKKVAMPY